MEQHKFKFRGKEYYANAPVLTEKELDNIVGTARTPNSRLVIVRGSTAVPLTEKINLDERPIIEEIPRGTVKGVFK
ncbi:MAG: hypothetical protein NT166_07480 [Candidatus Aminicenantes bacterium]|nr:hypothetical protein [Candidatus Aminicenantes bacterium]